MKIENPRLDIVSHKSYRKDELIRLVKKDGKILIDETQTMSGRGVYIHKDEVTIKKCSKAIARHLGVEPSEEDISNLLKLL